MSLSFDLLGPSDECCSDAELPLHSTGQALGKLVGFVGQSEIHYHGVCLALNRLIVDVLHFSVEPQMLVYCQTVKNTYCKNISSHEVKLVFASYSSKRTLC